MGRLLPLPAARDAGGGLRGPAARRLRVLHQQARLPPPQGRPPFLPHYCASSPTSLAALVQHAQLSTRANTSTPAHTRTQVNPEDGQAVEPYGFIYGRDDRDPRQDVPLGRCRFASYAPIASFYISERFADIPWPTTEDWEAGELVLLGIDWGWRSLAGMDMACLVLCCLVVKPAFDEWVIDGENNKFDVSCIIGSYGSHGAGLPPHLHAPLRRAGQRQVRLGAKGPFHRGQLPKVQPHVRDCVCDVYGRCAGRP